MLVEDEPQIRRFVRAALEEEGWQVHEAATVQRGLIDAGTRTPDLIILDLGLPDGDGIDLIGDIAQMVERARSSCCRRAPAKRTRSAPSMPAPTTT